MSKSGKSENPFIKPLVLILAGIISSYLGLFYFNEVPLIDFLLVIMGVIFPIVAILFLWRDRHKFTQ